MPLAAEELRQRIVEKIGDDGMLVCPRCDDWVLVHVEDEPVASAARVARLEAARRIGRSASGIRFATGDPQGARSSVFRIWTNARKDDVYIAARSLASELKVSLHPNFWYFGFTKVHAQREGSLVPQGTDRKLRSWNRPNELGPGWTRAFAVLIPGSELSTPVQPYEGSETLWLPPPEPDEIAHFTVVLSRPGAARGRRGFPSEEGFELSTEAVTRLNLATGEQVWVLFHVAPIRDHERSEIERARERSAQALRDGVGAGRLPADSSSLRVLIFGETADGARHFIDLAHPSSAAGNRAATQRR